MSAALAAVVLVFSSLLGMLHEATTAHVRCAAHGELVDSDGLTTAAAGPACGTIAGAQPSARGHGDEHCLLASAARAARIAPRSPAVVVALVTVDRLVAAPPGRAPVRAAVLYRIAPKTSPPA